MNRERIPDLILEQYLLGEVDDVTAERIENDEAALERLEDMKADSAAFLEAFPPEVFARRIENQFEATHSEARRTVRRRRTLTLSLGLPAAAILALGIVTLASLSPAISESGTATEITRLKGAEPRMQIYRAEAADATLLNDGATAAAGDVLQITYNAAESRFGMICSLDGNGVVTLHYPVSESADPALAGGGTQQLQYAYRLDDAPDFENFYFITAETEFSVRTIMNLVRGEANRIVGNPSGELGLPASLTVQTISIVKGE